MVSADAVVAPRVDMFESFFGVVMFGSHFRPSSRYAYTSKCVYISSVPSSCMLLFTRCAPFSWFRAAETIGCRVHGITLSKEQMALAEEKVKPTVEESLV